VSATRISRRFRDNILGEGGLGGRGLNDPRAHSIYAVKPSAITEIPKWIKCRAVPGLAELNGYIWLNYGTMKLLVALDESRGGNPEVVQVEFRYCRVCRRPLLADEAAAYRLRITPELSEPECGMKCAGDLTSRIWFTLHHAPA